MTNRRPTPLKDEPAVPFDELQELLTANLDAMEKLHKTLLDRSETNQPALVEVIAAATSNAVRELLEQRQRNFEQEEKEAIAQGKLTPQECYSRLAADYTAMLEQYKMVCKAYEYVVGLVKHLNGTRETYDARMRLFNDKLDIIFERLNAQAASAKKPAFPTRPKRFKDLPALLFRDLPLYFLRRICWSLLV